MAAPENRMATPLLTAGVGAALAYAGFNSFEKTDGIPVLFLEGIAVATGLMLVYLAITAFFRKEESEEVEALPTRMDGFLPSRELDLPEDYWHKPVVASADQAAAALNTYPFVERRRGGDRRAGERRQNISWSSEAHRQGPGRRRNNGRRATDRYSLSL